MEEIYKELKERIKEKERNLKNDVEKFNSLKNILPYIKEPFFELRAYEIISDKKYVEMVDKIYLNEYKSLIENINKDFNFMKSELQIDKIEILENANNRKLMVDYINKVNERFNKSLIIKRDSLNKINLSGFGNEINNLIESLDSKVKKNIDNINKFEEKYMMILGYIKSKLLS